jgi:Beta-ketoacyl synthase, N-terminal domain
MAQNQEDNITNKYAIPQFSGSLADNDNVFEQKRKMPKWEVDEDIVISGIAGRFPESDTMDEFADNLYKNINMISFDDRRWPAGNKRKAFKIDCLVN